MAVPLVRAPGINVTWAKHCPAARPAITRFSRAHTVTAAHNRNGSWYGGSAEALEHLIEDMAKQVEQAARQWRVEPGGSSGGFFWPGGYAYGTSRCGTYGSDKQRSKGAAKRTSTPSLPLDVVSAGDFYLLYADVPGLAKSDLSIKLSGPNKEPRVLKISGQRTAPYQQQQQQSEGQGDKADDSSSVVQQQRVFGSFGSSWELPADADSEGISAKVSEGVLTVTVPKKKKEELDDNGQEIAIE